MMNLESNFLIYTYRKIKNNLPNYVLRSIIKLSPIYLASSIFEIFGLILLVPVIKLIIEPAYKDENSYFRFLYDFFRFNSIISFVLFLFTSITLIFLLKNIILFFISKKQIKISFNMASTLSLEKYTSYLNKPYSFFSEKNSAILLRNMAQIPFDLIANIVIPFISILNEILILVLVLILLTIYNPLLFISLMLFTLPFLFVYNKVHKQKLRDISDKKNKGSASLFKQGLQSVELYREILIYDKKKFFGPLFKRTLDSYTKSISEVYLLNLISPKIVETLAIFSIFSIFITGYLLNKNITVLAQFLIVFAVAAYRIIPSINKIILYTNYIKSNLYIFESFEKTEWTEEIKTTISPNNIPELKFNDTLEVKNIDFQYENREENILSDLNLTIKKGETIGIVGPSGAGKTTLLNILLRLYTENEGGIYVDGIKINKDNLSAWYKLISYVPQNILLLDGTIAENIAFGVPKNEIDTALLERVIDKSQLKIFVSEAENGIDTRIGEKGIKISGGQRQRIGIARALYHGGKILIFDEATSALDSETEKMLTEAINEISDKDLTIIIVAHRVQTLKYCTKIYELKNKTLTVKSNLQHG